MDRYEISEINLGKNKYICFELLEDWILNFSLKTETMRNIHNSLLYAGVRYLLWRYRNFSLAFIFFRTFEAIDSPLNLESSWQTRYSTVLCCLMEWPAKDVSISLKPLPFEKRKDLVSSSSKWIDSLFSKNHWNSDENSLFKKCSIFLTSSC